MRFTEIRRLDGEIQKVWSWATDGQPAMTTERLQGYLDQLPTLADGERIMVVESYTYDSPFFAVGLEDRIIPNFTPMRPRYGSCIAFTPDPAVPSSGCLITGTGTRVAGSPESSPDPTF